MTSNAPATDSTWGQDLLMHAILTPVEARNAFERTVEQLGTAIRLGVFVPGQLLPPERELADTLGVARGTLREAIAALRSAELVSTRRGRGGGTTVATQPSFAPGHAPTGTELASLLSFRQVVETGSAQLAAKNPHSGEELAQLEAAAEATNALQDADAYRAADARFHLLLAAMSGSSHLAQSVGFARGMLADALLRIPFLERNIEHSVEEHRLLAQHVRDGNVNAAREVMLEHCNSTAALLKGLLC